MKEETFCGEVGMAIKVHGKKIKEYSHEGRRYIWAKNKTEYNILCWNNTPRRVEVVLSVDGLSVMNGRLASYDLSGYVIEAKSSIEIPGYRLNNEAVAKFIFGNREESYASKTERDENIGVIGAGFYLEKWFAYYDYSAPPYTIVHADPTYYGTNKPIPICHNDGAIYCQSRGYSSVSCYNSSEAPSIGTVFGGERGFKTQTTSFTREDSPPVLLSLYYKSREELERMGIRLNKRTLVVANPFPANNTGCTPPSGWSR